MTEEELSEIRQAVEYGIGTDPEVAEKLLAEVDRLRAENAALTEALVPPMGRAYQRVFDRLGGFRA